MSVFYLGQFPPPFGGVTVKNALLFQALGKLVPLRKLEFRRMRTASIVRRVLFSKPEDIFLVGFGNRRTQRLFIKGLGFVRPSVLKRLIIIVMGGEISGEIANDRVYARLCGKARGVYFETEGMEVQARTAGLSNTRVFPNCRHRPSSSRGPKPSDSQIKAVFFSLIDPSKGADLILEAARQTPAIEYHFYGRVTKEFERQFKSDLAGLPNVTYHGVFDAVGGDVYAELRKYDIHLFPTRCLFEGVPGVLVETKIASVPSVVSNVAFNTEIVEDGVSGIVLQDGTAEELARVLRCIEQDHAMLDDLKRGSRESAEQFFLDVYLEQILADIEG